MATDRHAVPRVAAARLCGQPLLIHPAKLDAIIAGLHDRLGLHDQGAAHDAPPVRAARMDAPARHAAGGQAIAVVPIEGDLVRRGGGMSPDSTPLLSYERLRAMLAEAAADPAIGGLLLRVDSWGGEAQGVADLASYVASLTVPVWAMVDSNAYSAAYWLASAADRVLVTRDGGVGSVGVVAVHVDESAADAAAGRAYTYVYAGARKVDLTPHAPLSDPGRATLQAIVDRHFAAFTAGVAANRTAAGRPMSAADIAALDAGLFHGADAIAAGLADEISTYEDALAAFADFIARPSAAGRAAAMADPTPTAAPPVQGAQIIDFAAERDRAVAEARAAERARSAAIHAACAEAGHPALAAACIAQDLSLEQVRERIEAANEIAAVCAIHKLPSLSASMIARGLSLAEAKAELLDHRLKAQGDEEISSRVPGTAAGTERVSVSEIYERHNRVLRAAHKAALQQHGLTV